MTHLNEEASPIARLIGPDGKRTVGWVYVWETLELSILLLGKQDAVSFIDPEIRVDILAAAEVAKPKDVIAFLRSLQKPTSSSGCWWTC